MITQALNLNLIPGQVLPRVNVSQYDSGTRTLQMSLYNGTQAFNVTSGVLGFIQGTKPDRTGFQYSATVTSGSNVVTADITQQMTAVSGDVVTELVLVSGDDQIATVNFIIHVEPAALADDTVISDTELPLIEEAAELAERIDGIIAQIDADADKSEAYAVGTKGGTPVPSTDPTYHNNSKYYSEQAAASAASIGDLAEDAEAWAVGTRDGAAVPSTDPAYHNNSKYYAQDAGDKATDAGTSATSASTNALKAEGFAVGEQNGTAVTSGSPYYHNNAEYFAGEASTSATNASTSETNAGLSESAAAQSEEDSEAWAIGERNGVPVTSGDPTFQNNAKYYAQQAGGTALSSLVDVAISGATNGQVLGYNSTSQKWENKSLGSAAAKNSTNAVTQSSTDLVESGAVYTEVSSLNSDLSNVDTVISENGAKNLVPVTQTTQTFTKNGQTITFTVNPSGYPEGTVIVNGTYPEDIVLSLYGSSTNRLIDAGILVKGKSYHISGCPSGGGNSTYWLHFNYRNAQSQSVEVKEQGSGLDVTIPSDSNGGGNLGVYIKGNVTCNNVVFKPMITLADYPLSDYAHYVPYAKTNRELTEISTPIIYKFETADADANVTYLKSQAIKMGDMVFLTGTWIGNNTSAESLLTLPNDLKPTGSTTVYGVGSGERSSGTDSGHYVIKNSGKVFQSLSTQAVNNGQFTFIYSISKS